MSETRTFSNNRADSSPSSCEAVLPQWAVDMMRPPIRLVCRLLWKIQFKGTEHIPPDGGVIIASNHQTYIDPFWISIPIRRPLRYLAWDAAFDWPLIGRLMKTLGAWPLQLEGSDPSAIRRTLQWLRNGGAVVIFPEGGRGKPDGSLIHFKAGATRVALDAGVPILPVTIRGANRVWPSNRRFPGTANVEIIYHPLYRVGQQAGEEPRACARRQTDELAKIIASAL